MELGRRASRDTALLPQVAAMIRDPRNMRVLTAAAASISQLGTEGLIAGGRRAGGGAGPRARRRMGA